MKTLGTAIANHIQQELTSLATFWRITRRDTVVKGFTSGDVPVVIDGVIYEPSTGFNASAFSQDNSLAVRNLDLNSVISSSGLSELDLVGGKYDYARVDIFLANWSNPPASLSTNPPNHILMVSGFLGEVSLSDIRYTAEIRSFSQLLQQKIGTITTPGCRAIFGDSKCKKDLSGLTDNLTITAVFSQRSFAVSDVRPNGFFSFGEMTFTSGQNQGIKSMVLAHDTGFIQTVELLPFTVNVGDTVTAIAGCDKTVGSCKNYNNIINFQGEPHIPGEDTFLAGFQ